MCPSSLAFFPFAWKNAPIVGCACTYMSFCPDIIDHFQCLWCTDFQDVLFHFRNVFGMHTRDAKSLALLVHGQMTTQLMDYDRRTPVFSSVRSSVYYTHTSPLPAIILSTNVTHLWWNGIRIFWTGQWNLAHIMWNQGNMPDLILIFQTRVCAVFTSVWVVNGQALFPFKRTLQYLSTYIFGVSWNANLKHRLRDGLLFLGFLLSIACRFHGQDIFAGSCM